MPDTETPTEHDLTSTGAVQERSAKDLNKLSLGYVLMGFGTPTSFASFLILGILFGQGRNTHAPPLVAFRIDHPAFLMAGFGFLAGVTMLIFGFRLTRADRQEVPSHYYDTKPVASSQSSNPFLPD